MPVLEPSRTRQRQQGQSHVAPHAGRPGIGQVHEMVFPEFKVPTFRMGSR